jgi:tetratricopeptide (TPR) repeat protein
MRKVIFWSAIMWVSYLMPAQACDFCIKGRQAFRASTPILIEGMGRHHHPVTTTSEEVQCYFDQGLTFCFAFNHDEAARSFRHAAELDSTLAMAYWGVAYSLGTNYNQPIDSVREIEAYQNIQKALALAEHASQAERDYINAMAKRYTDDPKPNYAALDSAYMKAMKELCQKYPDDLDAATLFVESAMNLRPWKLWNKDGTPAPGTDEIVSVLESVLDRNPDHAGAIHFYIHAVESSPDPYRALAPADRLGAQVPAAGHLVHMPGHAYIRTGFYEKSIEANYAAVKLDSTYVAAGGGSGFYSMIYYPHNVHFLAVSYALDGQFEKALHYSRMLDEVAGPNYGFDPHIEGVGPTKWYILAKYHKWDMILSEPAPDTSLKVLTAVHHFARGMAYANKGEVANAKAELADFDRLEKEFQKGALMGMINDAHVVAPIPRLILKAQIAIKEDKTEEAVKFLYEAAAVKDGLEYDEPEAWYIAPRELLGALLIKLGRFDEAEKVFRQDLVRYPREGRLLFGLMTALEKNGKTYEAAMVRQDFNRSWARADTELNIENL